MLDDKYTTLFLAVRVTAKLSGAAAQLKAGRENDGQPGPSPQDKSMPPALQRGQGRPDMAPLQGMQDMPPQGMPSQQGMPGARPPFASPLQQGVQRPPPSQQSQGRPGMAPQQGMQGRPGMAPQQGQGRPGMAPQQGMQGTRPAPLQGFVTPDQQGAQRPPGQQGSGGQQGRPRGRSGRYS